MRVTSQQESAIIIPHFCDSYRRPMRKTFPHLVTVGHNSDGQEGQRKGEREWPAHLLPSATHDTGGWLMV